MPREPATAAQPRETVRSRLPASRARPIATLTLNHRRLRAHRHADGAIWFAFKELCEGPRGQADYIEIARCYHTVFLTDVPVLGPDAREPGATLHLAGRRVLRSRGEADHLRRQRPSTDLYRGAKLTFEFERTKSRLIEMQSQDYLARPHQA